LKEQFVFKANRVPLAQRLEYVKSNRDGTNRLTVSVFMPDQSHVQVVKLRDGAADAPLVMAELDYTTFSATSLQSCWLYRDGSRKAQATFEQVGNKFVATRYFAYGRPPQSIEFATPAAPFHFYNFDLVSFSLMVPHLKDAAHDFAIELLDLSPAIGGRMECSLAGSESRNGYECNRFSVGGPAFRGETGELWIDASSGLMVDFEHPVPDNPDWDDFRMTLQTIHPMDAAGWTAWIEEELQRRLVDPDAGT
jgi:hypothetical protein